jgi:hypothetical protein
MGARERVRFGREELGELRLVDRRRRRHPAIIAPRRDGRAAGPSGGADQWSRRVYPQIAQVATPVCGSSSRKLVQPFVEQ